MKECFVIMPIGSDTAYNVYANRYKYIIEAAVESFRINEEQIFRCVRSDFVNKSGSITQDLLERLYRSDAVIADLTDLNANVFYELGVRHALRSGTILIALKGTKPAFDVGDLRVIHYEDRVGAEKEAIPQIQNMLTSLLNEEKLQDSPVLLAIPELSEFGAVKEYEARIASLQNERDVLKAQLEVSEKTSLMNQSSLETMREAIERLSQQLSEPARKEAETEIESVARKKQVVSPMMPSSLANVKVEPDTVFVLMPMLKELDALYDVIRATAEEVGLRSYRADTISAAGSIIDQIFESIAKSGLIIADLSGRNQNVIYELGLANAMGKETLLLSQDIQDVPFDVRHRRVLLYDLSMGKVLELKRMLSDAFYEHRKRVGLTANSAKDHIIKRIHLIYQQLGKDPSELQQISAKDGEWGNALSYEITRHDGKRTHILRSDLDDDNDFNIKRALMSFSDDIYVNPHRVSDNFHRKISQPPKQTNSLQRLAERSKED